MVKDSPPPTNSWSSVLPRLGGSKNAKGGTGGPSSSSLPPPPPLKKYHPSIFRYVCRGRLSLDSIRRPHEAGVCKGFQSQLEHVDQWKLSTEEEAIRVFQAKSALNDAAADAAANSAAGAANGPGVSSAHALQSIYLTNVLVYPSSSSTAAQHPKDQDKTNPPNEDNSVLKSASEEEWSCYGSTEVDLLVLRPEDSKEETIAAVSPYCAPGMTVRDIRLPEYPNTLDRTSTIRLGFLEILYQSSLEEEEDEEDQVATPSQNRSEEAHPMAKGRKRASEKADPSKTPPFWIRFGTSSTNLWNQMGINARLLVQATQEDFVGRSLAASEKVAAEFPRTLERTWGLMRKVLTGDWSPPPPPPTGGPPPPF